LLTIVIVNTLTIIKGDDMSGKCMVDE